MQRVPASRDSEFVQQQETSSQREEKSTIETRWMKEAHQKLTEKQSAIQAQLDAQVRCHIRSSLHSSPVAHEVGAYRPALAVGCHTL